jgi:hypothetical protein
MQNELRYQAKIHAIFEKLLKEIKKKKKKTWVKGKEQI